MRDAGRGSLYGFQLNGRGTIYPDPVSRYQPYGPHKLSQVVDSGRFPWMDQRWQGVPRECCVYEMHIGTFTQAGNFLAAAEKLPDLRALGIAVLEIMPAAEFDGRFGWGYDSVALFAPYHHYGSPDELRFFVDRADTCMTSWIVLHLKIPLVAPIRFLR